MALRTQNSYFRSGICRIFNSWNSACASKFSCFRKSLQGAPNVNNRCLLVCSIVKEKKYQTQTYKSVVKCIKKERSLMYSTSTSALEEGKTLSLTGPLTKLQAHDLIMRLTREERTALLTVLQEFQAEKRKAEYESKIYYVSGSDSVRPVIYLFVNMQHVKILFKKLPSSDTCYMQRLYPFSRCFLFLCLCLYVQVYSTLKSE
jgi:hypothetical protein